MVEIKCANVATIHGILSNGLGYQYTTPLAENGGSSSGNGSDGGSGSMIGLWSSDNFVCKIDIPYNPNATTTTNSNNSGKEDIRYYVFSHQSGYDVTSRAYIGTRSSAKELMEKGVNSIK